MRDGRPAFVTAVLAYLPIEMLERDGFTVEAFGERSPATLVDGAAYDPARKKILC